MKATFILLFFFSCCYKPSLAATSIEQLAKAYADAYLEKSADKILSLYNDDWSNCKYPQYNELLKADFIERDFNSKIYQNYRIELNEINKTSSDEDSLGLWLGIKDVIYFPIVPTHSLSFWLVDDEKTSMHSRPVAEVEGDWVFVHSCAGDGAKEFLEKHEVFERS